MDLARPHPPKGHLYGFQPAEELRAWIMATFIDEGAPLENDDHVHLMGADLAVLWAFEPAKHRGRYVAASAEIPNPRGSLWSKARQEWQLRQWFGHVPALLLTFSAEYADEIDDASWCALVEHELYHCAHAEGERGPRYHRDGTPVYTMRGHDVEEFVGVVERYGADAAGSDVRAMVEAASTAPRIATAEIAAACGTCIARAA